VIAARSRDFSARLSAAARHADATSRQRVHRLLVCVDRVARGGRRRRRRIAPAARDRTRGVDTFRFTKVLSKPTTVSRLEHVVRGRMKRARRGDAVKPSSRRSSRRSSRSRSRRCALGRLLSRRVVLISRALSITVSRLMRRVRATARPWTARKGTVSQSGRGIRRRW